MHRLAPNRRSFKHFAKGVGAPFRLLPSTVFGSSLFWNWFGAMKKAIPEMAVSWVEFAAGEWWSLGAVGMALLYR
jgi:hypothetical protein